MVELDQRAQLRSSSAVGKVVFNRRGEGA
jgi:hypothetical protein